MHRKMEKQIKRTNKQIKNTIPC